MPSSRIFRKTESLLIAVCDCAEVIETRREETKASAAHFQDCRRLRSVLLRSFLTMLVAFTTFCPVCVRCRNYQSIYISRGVRVCDNNFRAIPPALCRVVLQFLPNNQRVPVALDTTGFMPRGTSVFTYNLSVSVALIPPAIMPRGTSSFGHCSFAEKNSFVYLRNSFPNHREVEIEGLMRHEAGGHKRRIVFHVR